MKIFQMFLTTGLLCAGFAVQAAPADDATYANELQAIQHEFDVANFTGLGKSDRKHAFEALVDHAADFSERYPERVEAVAWNGIVLSTYAGEVGALSAMKYAKAAREALHNAESMSPHALDGGLYASLGALYAKVPGGFVGFGDEDLAREYFEKALAIDSDNIDSNFFFGEFLVDHEQYQQALPVLNRGLNAATVAGRPEFDAGRRQGLRELLDSAQRHLR